MTVPAICFACRNYMAKYPRIIFMKEYTEICMNCGSKMYLDGINYELEYEEHNTYIYFYENSIDEFIDNYVC